MNENNILAMGGGYNPFSTSMIADEKTALLQLGEGEEISNPVVDKLKMEQVLVPAILGCKISTALQSARRVTPTNLRWSRCSLVKTWWKLDVLS